MEYPEAYPLRRALEMSGRNTSGHLSGVEAFVAEICVDGIIEWAMEPVAGGDASRLEEVLGGAPVDADEETWETYLEKMQLLAGLRREESPNLERYD